ncbi:MAG: hypothetical protein ACRDXF_09780 [Acidimicrobiia bacterium]
MVGFSPDGGPTMSSLFQGFVLMVVFAAPAVGTLFASQQALAMGGAMFVAGAVLLPGGNVLGLLMLIPGFLLVWAGITSLPGVETSVWIRLTGTAVALVMAVYLALDGGVVAGSIALTLALVVVVVNSRGRTSSDFDGHS